MLDVLIVGAGPAGLAMAAALSDVGLRVGGIAPNDPGALWPNTYGIWADELVLLGLDDLLAQRWSNSVVYARAQPQPLDRSYGLFDNARLQTHLLERARRGQVEWQRGQVAQAVHLAAHSEVTTQTGKTLAARLVIDASGHAPVLVQRPPTAQVAYQTAYGLVGRFSAPPVDADQMVLMDYRGDHLSKAQRAEPPTFLYAMDLGEGRYFVEETSLAHAPALPLERLEQRLYWRLAHHGIRVEHIEHVERCRFPMNLPLPDLYQPVLGFGGAAGMVHPATGYQVGAALRRAPEVAQALAQVFDQPNMIPQAAARAGWEALWPGDQVRRRSLYLFGLAAMLRLDLRQTQDFFASFFHLPRMQWQGYLSDTLTTPELLQTMLGLFGRVPLSVRLSLLRSVGSGGDHLWRTLAGQAPF